MNKLTLTAAVAVTLALSTAMVPEPAAAHDDAAFIGAVIGLAGGYYLGKHAGYRHHHGHHGHRHHGYRGDWSHGRGHRGYRGHGHHRGHDFPGYRRHH